jgi:hypothetical protein
MTAYKPRNNRCKGFYMSNLSRAAFDLVSCTYGGFRFKSAQKELITIQLPDKLGKNLPAGLHNLSLPARIIFMQCYPKAGQ